MFTRILFLLYFVIFGVGIYCDGSTKIRRFPKNLKFGVATAAYQVEGGWDAEGKGRSIWDELTHSNPHFVKDSSNGDYAADSYHLWRRDVDMLKSLGVDYYRFSISWPRILPTGFADHVNEPGVMYYNNIINELLTHNITPVVTIYHWDLPANLQTLGGFTNPLIADWFEQYSRVVFEKFGDRVKHWITINEPKQICYEGYGSDLKAPALNMSGIAEYICAKNLLLAHASAYNLYDKQFRKNQNGVIGISISCTWFEPSSDSVEDQKAAEDAAQFDWGQYAHPIFSKAGDFPEILKMNIQSKSLEQKFPKSRLPTLSPGEVEFIRGSSDFFGVNTYTTRMARKAGMEGSYAVPSYMDDMDAIIFKDDSWPQAASLWLQYVPWGFFKLLRRIHSLYDNPPIWITENGWSSEGELNDEDRVQYLEGYLNAMLDAIELGADVRGYTVWSLMDNFEWKNGYTEKFGLYHVDFHDDNYPRTPRKSAFLYKEIIRNRYIRESIDVQISRRARAPGIRGKGRSIWDELTHSNPHFVKDSSNGDYAADSYHLWRRDVDMLKSLGVDYYRFSISWPRILPTGFANHVNEPGVMYYNNIINELLTHNITPVVTIYHWDLPANLQTLGGFTNPLIADWFEQYSRVVYEKFGDRVKHWITINEPKQICYEGYGSDLKAPALNMSGIAEYICAKNLLLAHASAYNLYDKQFRKNQNGVIGISISCTWFEPSSDSVEDQKAAEDAAQFDWGQYAHPIFSKAGDFPEILKMNIQSKSLEQKFPKSRLPTLSLGEVEFIRGSSDFFGVNTYTTRMARKAGMEGSYAVPSYMDDMDAIIFKDDSWPQAASLWLQYVPWGFFKLLRRIHSLYDNPPIWITENGWSSEGELNDEDRVQYLEGYLNAMLDAIELGADVRGYTVWSLMDNFEWKNGYTEKFGLYHVDFHDDNYPRTPRKSAFLYKEIIRNRYIRESIDVQISRRARAPGIRG